MNARRDESPERLLEGDGTAFERRVLQQAQARGPSTELTQRMAKALGVGVTTLAGPSSAAAPRAPTPASHATSVASSAAAKSGAAWVLVPAAVVALSVAGIAVGLRGTRAVRPAPVGNIEPAEAPAITPPRDDVAVPVAVAVPAKTGAGAPRTAPDLRAEIELVDGARSAVTRKDAGRALEILRRYEARYPTGSFAPEATATKVEALMQLGHVDEARALAARFVAAHPGTLLAERVAAAAGLPR